MNTRKSFDHIHEDYLFFGTHSTEGSELRKAMLPILSESVSDSGGCRALGTQGCENRSGGDSLCEAKPGGRLLVGNPHSSICPNKGHSWTHSKPAQKARLRWLDFGCGSGEFFRGLLAALDRPASATDLALVDVDRGYLEEAREKVAGFTANEVAVATSPEELEGAFDLITSKHALYYVKDLRATVRALCGLLKPEGLALFILGGKENHLSGLWESAYAARKLPVPYYRAEDLAGEIEAAGCPCETRTVNSTLRFPDSRENRLKILRFLFAGNTVGMTPESLLPLLDSMKHEDDIVIGSTCSLFLVRARLGGAAGVW